MDKNGNGGVYEEPGHNDLPDFSNPYAAEAKRDEEAAKAAAKAKAVALKKAKTMVKPGTDKNTIEDLAKRVRSYFGNK